MLDQRGRLLRAAVGLATISMPSYDRALWALRSWLDSWSGIGHVAVGMARQGYDLVLTRHRAPHKLPARLARWVGRATTPWQAIQSAAWQAAPSQSRDLSVIEKSPPRCGHGTQMRRSVPHFKLVLTV
jgi:hypothetical protein